MNKKCLSIIKLNWSACVIMLSVVMPSAVLPSVVAPVYPLNNVTLVTNGEIHQGR